MNKVEGYRTTRQVFLLWCLSIWLVACGGGGQDAFKDAVAVNELNVIAIDVQSDNSVIEVGMLENYRALGTVQDDPGNPIDVTSRVRWSTSNSAVASINQAGILTGRTAGMVAVRAEWADLNDSKELEVSNALLQSITIGDIPARISECGNGYQLSATGNYDDGSSRVITDDVIWTTSQLTLASIDRDGVLATFGDGAVDLIATRNDLSGTAVEGRSSVTIEDNLNDIAVSPVNPTLAVGADRSFVATGSYTNDADRVITDSVTWSSDDANVLTISNEVGARGFAEAQAVGSATVRAECDPSEDFANDESLVTVVTPATVNAVEINGGVAEVEVDLSDGDVQLEAYLKLSDGSTGDRVTDSDDISWAVVATISGTGAEVSDVSGSKGLVSFTATGITEIRARYDSDTLGPFTDTIEVEVR